MELQMIVQALQLLHGNAYPQILNQNMVSVCEKLGECAIIDQEIADRLGQIVVMYNTIYGMKELCLNIENQPHDQWPFTLKDLLVRLAGVASFDDFESMLRQAQKDVQRFFHILLVCTTIIKVKPFYKLVGLRLNG